MRPLAMLLCLLALTLVITMAQGRGSRRRASDKDVAKEHRGQGQDEGPRREGGGLMQGRGHGGSRRQGYANRGHPDGGDRRPAGRPQPGQVG